MNITVTPARRALFYVLAVAVLLATMGRLGGFMSPRASAQDAGQKSAEADATKPRPAVAPADQRAKLAEAEKLAEAALSAEEKSKEEKPLPIAPAEEISVWDLYWQGGVLMYPITFMSFLVVIFGIERMIGLRRSKVLPSGLMEGLSHLAAQPGGLDPRLAYKLCQRFPSAAANVVRSMLLKLGRPNSEVEHTVAEANEREANRLYANVRWLNLSASVAPLMGLLGTVQGMIMAFFVTAHLPPGANKAESLAQGIYVALVTTFGGLTVAIPASMLAHFFEGRIQSLFRELDDGLMGLLPQLERFEGRLRVRKRPAGGTEPPTKQPPAAAPK